MTLTINSLTSGGGSYLPAANFLALADIRTVADLISDTGVRSGGTVPNPATVAANANLLAALQASSGELELSLLRGNRYDPASLALLSTTACAGQGWLFWFLTRLTTAMLFLRRPDKGPMPELYAQVLVELKEIADGDAVLPFLEAQTAGLPADQIEVCSDVEKRNLTSFLAGRFYGRRANRIDGGWSGWGSCGGC